MRRIAISAATAAFFGLAVVSWASGLPAFSCAVKALTGAVVIYVVVTVAGRVVLRIIVDAMIGGESSETHAEDTFSDRRNH